jgi:hypothetical protein
MLGVVEDRVRRAVPNDGQTRARPLRRIREDIDAVQFVVVVARDGPAIDLLDARATLDGHERAAAGVLEAIVRRFGPVHSEPRRIVLVDVIAGELAVGADVAGPGNETNFGQLIARARRGD